MGLISNRTIYHTFLGMQWEAESSRGCIEFNTNSMTIKIHSAGTYYLYAQLYYNMQGTYHGASHCIVLGPSTDDLQPLRCAVMSPTQHPRGRHGWRNLNTVNLFALAELEENSMIGVQMYVRNREVPLDEYVNFAGTYSYFGALQMTKY